MLLVRHDGLPPSLFGAAYAGRERDRSPGHRRPGHYRGQVLLYAVTDCHASPLPGSSRLATHLPALAPRDAALIRVPDHFLATGLGHRLERGDKTPAPKSDFASGFNGEPG